MSTPTKPETTCLIMSLPDELVVDILARVSTRFHPSISAVCRRFRSLISSPELYKARRSLLGCNEHRLYIILHSFGENSESQSGIYNLRRKPDGGRRLVPVSYLPVMPHEASYVAAGSRHVFGGFSLHDRREPSALSIGRMLKFYKCKNVCVVDGVLYSYFCNELRAYDDTKHGYWREVKGVGTLLLPGEKIGVGWWPRVVDYGGKLLLLYQKTICRKEELWCAEIALERRQDGEIWGKVEWSDLVIVGDFCLIESLVVMF